MVLLKADRVLTWRETFVCALNVPTSQVTLLCTQTLDDIHVDINKRKDYNDPDFSSTDTSSD